MGIRYEEDAPATGTIRYEDAPQTTGLQRFRESIPSVQSVVRGMPIIGPAIDAGTKYLLAGGESAVTGKPVQEIANKYERENERVRREHPVASTAGEIAGSLLSTVPVARAVPALFGGRTMIGQVGAGAGIGGADAAVRSGGDLDAIKTGALIGGAAPVMGSILAPVGQGIASGARYLADKTPGVRSVFAPSVKVPTGREVLDDATRGYQSLAGQMTYTPYSLDTLSSAIKQGLRNRNVSAKVGAVEAHNILDTLSSLPPNPGSLHTIRKKLGKVSGDSDEIASAGYAREIIDKFLENPTANTVVTQGGQQQASNVLKTLQEANANYQAGKTSATWRKQLDDAALEAKQVNQLVPSAVEGQIIRRLGNNLLRGNKTAAKFFTPAQREAMETAITPGSLGQGLLDVAGKTSMTARPGLGGLVSMLGTGGAWLAGADPWTAAALFGAGLGSNVASTALTRRAAEHADKVIRAASPFGQATVNAQRQPPISLTPAFNPRLHSSISPRDHRNEIARLLALQATREAVE